MTISQLKEVNNPLSPNIIFLSETKNKTAFMKKVKRRMKFDECFVVDAVGKLGGMVLMWNNDVKILEINQSALTIEAHVVDTETQLD